MQVLISTPHQHILVYDMWWPGGMVNYSVYPDPEQAMHNYDV